MKNNPRAYDDVIAFLQNVPPGKSLQAFKTDSGAVKVLSSGTIYVAGTTAELASRNGSLIKAGLELSPEATNLETANKLPKGQYLRVVGQRFLFETTAGKTLADANWKSEAPANWKNSHFEVFQNGDGRLFKAPVTRLTNFKGVSTGNDNDFNSNEPFVIRPETIFDPKVTLAVATTVENQLWRWEADVQIVQDADK